MQFNSPHKLTWKPTAGEMYPDRGVFPNGQEMDLSRGIEPACTFVLPYPANGYGYWQLYCKSCKHSQSIAANGRVDDPKSYKVDCRPIKEVKIEAKRQLELAI